MFVILPALSACLAKNYNFEKDVFAHGKMSYVVLEATNNLTPKNCTVYNIFEFKNENGDKVSLSLSGSKAFMIPPGNYKLTNFELKGGHSYGNMNSSVYLEFKRKTEGGFSVSAGKSVYLGKVTTVITAVNKSF